MHQHDARGVREFRSMLLKCKLAQDTARGFGVALLRHKLVQDVKGCLRMVLMTWEWRRQVRIVS